MGEAASGRRHEAMVDKIAQVCRDLDAMRAALHDVGEAACLDRLVEVVRSGGDASGPLQRIDELLGEDDDVLDLFTGRRGASPIRGPANEAMITRGRSGIRPAGVGGSRVFVCPASRCTRIWWPHSQAAEPPRCQIFAERLRTTILQ